MLIKIHKNLRQTALQAIEHNRFGISSYIMTAFSASPRYDPKIADPSSANSKALTSL